MPVEDEVSADALLSLLLDSIPDYIYFKDRDRRFVRASRAFEELLGLGPGEIIGKRDEDVFPPAMTENTIPDDLRVIEQGEPVLKRIEGGRSPAGERYVSTTKLPWRSPTAFCACAIGRTWRRRRP